MGIKLPVVVTTYKFLKDGVPFYELQELKYSLEYLFRMGYDDISITDKNGTLLFPSFKQVYDYVENGVLPN